MSDITVTKDPEALTMTVTATLDAGVERAWQLWADPRQLERWWGPPEYPATFTDHDLTTGGRVAYSMTGPEGDTHHGWWQVLRVDPPTTLELDDGFADAEGRPNPDLPVTRMLVTLAEVDGRTQMTMASRFPSLETMEQLAEMGMEEGITAAMGQIDAILAGAPSTR